MTPRDGPGVLCVAGESGRGKTTLIRRLAERVPVPRRRLGLVKHTHHAIQWHPSGKDSAVLWDLDPGGLVVAGPDQTAGFVPADRGRAPGPRSAPDDPTRNLLRACGRLPGGLRLILAEGFRGADAPTVWAAGPPVPDLEVPGLRAVATPARHRSGWADTVPGVPVFDRDDVEGLASRVAEWSVPLQRLGGPER